jgi:tryptophanyl-tRNA synthetase
VLDEFKGAQFSTFKGALSELVVAKLSPIAGEMRRLLADPAEIDRVLRDGAEKARAAAAPVMAEVRRVVGFVS